jgi:hypothetical protein
MLHPRFFDMVALAARRRIRVSANTNLTLLTPQRARRCVDCGLAAISVSLDGASAAVYEAIRRKASFAKVIRNLNRLMEARDAAGSALEVRGVMVLMHANLHELPALLRLLHVHGVRELLVQRLSSDLSQPQLPARYIPIREFVSDAELRPADLARAAQVFAEARALATALDMTLHLPRLDARPGSSADRASFGKVFDDEDAGAPRLSERWHGEGARAFRAALASGQPPSVCRSCALYHGTF